MIKHRAHFISATCAAALCVASAAAQAGELDEADFTSLSLKELVSLEVFTSASLLPTQTSKAPGTAYTFSRKEFDQFGVRTLDDLMAFIPGLQLNQYRKRHRSIWARGLLDRYNDKMVLMVDGVRMRSLYYGHFSLGDNLPLENIEKVEVILGPASSLYGANAFGGLISITTRAFSATPEYTLTGELADHQRRKGTLSYNSPAFQAFASYTEQDAPFSSDRQSFIGTDVLQPLDEDFSNIMLKGQPMPGLTLSLNYSDNSTPFLFIPSSQDAFVDEQLLTVAANYEQGTLDTGRLESTLYFQRDRIKEYEIEQNSRALGYIEHQNATKAGASLTGLKRYGDHTLAAGVSWQHEQADATDFKRFFHYRDGFLDPARTGNLLSQPGITNNDYALFAQDVWDISPELNLTLGGRYDDFDQFGGYFNYRAALVFTPDTRQTLKAQYGTAIRTPTLREYLKVMEGTSFVPPVADAEEIRSLELGYAYQWDEANLSLNLFRSQLDNFILETPTPDVADEYFSNRDERCTMYGAEALFNTRLSDRLNLRLGLAYLQADTTHGELPYLATWSSSLKLDYRYRPEHGLGLSLLHNSSRDDTNSFIEDNADGFVVTNLYAFGQINPGLSYTAGIDNLFDEQVFDPAADFGTQYNNERSERVIWLRLSWSGDF
ncbi:TonB-dependent receptor [Marinobacterium maritimum]|uniref:TonB-dependent receptor n=1 Tax=Marinobacterium maritimum TaxID=500162 RepID=A0ABP3TAL6_9GAMM